MSVCLCVNVSVCVCLCVCVCVCMCVCEHVTLQTLILLSLLLWLPKTTLTIKTSTTMMSLMTQSSFTSYQLTPTPLIGQLNCMMKMLGSLKTTLKRKT